MATRAWIVSGRVQGVFFRAATRNEALRLGITRGYARNLANGGVEVAAEGDEAMLSALGEFLHRGPPEARVEAVESAAAPREPLGDPFTIR